MYVIAGGSGRMKLDDEIVDVVPSDVIHVAPAVMRAFEAGAEGLDVFCVGGRRPPGGDTERDEGFWL